MNEIIEIKQADMLQAINRAEADIQISTAKQYPREIKNALNQILTYATMDVETAEDCFYALRRGRGDGDNAVIEGISVRLAEIIANAWGNLRVQTRIIGNDGRTITAQGICHDLETNVAVSVEVKRRITDKRGRTFSEDMQVVTGNAAAAIAFRNAVLKVVPKAVTKKVVNSIKEVAMGRAIDLETRRQNMLAYYNRLGVSEGEIFEYCNVGSVSEIDMGMVFELSGLKNALKEGTTTIAEVFRPKVAEKPVAKSNASNGVDVISEKESAAEASERVKEAMFEALGKPQRAKETPKEPIEEVSGILMEGIEE